MLNPALIWVNVLEMALVIIFLVTIHHFENAPFPLMPATLITLHPLSGLRPHSRGITIQCPGAGRPRLHRVPLRARACHYLFYLKYKPFEWGEFVLQASLPIYIPIYFFILIGCNFKITNAFLFASAILLAVLDIVAGLGALAAYAEYWDYCQYYRNFKPCACTCGGMR